MARDKAYQEAEKKIEEARRSGAMKLDLSVQSIEPRLTELPESLGLLGKLQDLDLARNQLTSASEFLGQLAQLRRLNLRSNQLTILQESIGNLTKLESLDIDFNKLETLPESFGQLTQLLLLTLNQNNLITLPESFGQLINLQSLNLTHNQLTTLPKSFGQLTQLQSLDLSHNQLTTLPESFGQLTQLKSLTLIKNNLITLPHSFGQLPKLRSLGLWNNQLTTLPESFGQLTQLKSLDLTDNQLTTLPESFGQLVNLQSVSISKNRLTKLPESIGNLSQLEDLHLPNNQLTDLPASLTQLEYLAFLILDDNPLNPELAEAYKQGLGAVKTYLRAKATAQIILNEAKLILVGEGEVGKSCLLGALRGDAWEENRPTTHGIEIKSVKVQDPDSKKEITLNGWDFGGQRVYRPTHQLFFSAPAVYLVVWKPREGPQQGFVKEWIKLVKHREPDAKILVVATHGGPQQRQPDIDCQELRDLFGADTIIDFFHVESKPDKNGDRRGITELKDAIARVAAQLPEMGRSVPKRWEDARVALESNGAAYLPFDRVLELCRELKMDDDEARLFITIEHRLGHLIHYEHDPALRDIVVLKPDWLSTAISYVLDDEQTRKNHGLVPVARLSQLWNDPARAAESRYPIELHQIFLRLMERFDLSYRVAGLLPNGKSDETSLIAQLVPDNRPEPVPGWTESALSGDVQQEQICRIVDAQNGQSATAEGLFYQLIVRLHKYSLGRVNYKESVHWQRGLVLDDDYNGRALMEHIGNDVRITVRGPYPERFLSVLTSEVKYLVDSFWTGLRCDVMVPCMVPCGKQAPGTGLFEVEKLIESKKRLRPEYPCPVCNNWQDIDHLLRNAPAARPIPFEELFGSHVLAEVRELRGILRTQHGQAMGRFDNLDAGQRELLSKADAAYTDLLQAFTDEAKEGPRLFSIVPVDRSNFNPKEWIRAKFRLTLWCEHSRQPLPLLNNPESKKGIYEIELTREWFKKAGPYLKLLTGTLSLVLPVALSTTKLPLDDAPYKVFEKQLDLSKSIIDAAIGEGTKVGEFMGAPDTTKMEPDKTRQEHGEPIRAQSETLRELHALLKAQDPGFGGLVRVRNKRQEFLWVHPQFEKEY